MQYRVLKEFWYVSNAAAIRRIKAGENMPMKERGMVTAHVGEVHALGADVVRSLAGKSDGPYVEEVPDGEA